MSLSLSAMTMIIDYNLVLKFILLVGQLGLNRDEGRGKLRKAWGSRMRALNPRFPNTSTFLFGEMPRGKLTPGIETSQYRQEKKTIVIPLLAASERGKGQTESSLEKEIEMW